MAVVLAVAGAQVQAATPAGSHPEPIPLTGFAKPARTVSPAPIAYFDWFEYAGHDSVFEAPLPPGAYRNPVLAGFHPDPSITRAGDTYYLVNSSFAYFPGIPVFASDDLVHWRPIGHVIERPAELSFDGLGVSRGLFAPTIRYHGGLFYVVCTAVDAGGNFLSVARNPAGPWSDPIWFSNLDGIDPSLFFDADGKVYLLNNGPPAGRPRYEGHRAIWIQELDLASRRLVGPRKVLVNGGVDFSRKPIWIEGPHMYRHAGWYLLICAEGGTGPQHSEVVLRARSPWGPFEPFSANPILTQRDLPDPRANAIANAGHADLVETKDGSWWAVFLASRTYESVHYNTGRETYMLPVTWHDGWPTILEAGTQIPYIVKAPASAAAPRSPPLTGNFTSRDEFDSAALQPQWLYVRIPKQPWADLALRPGWLALHALHTPLDSLHNVSFLARRQQHLAFDAITELETPAAPGMSAGLAAFQNESYWYFLGVRRLPPADIAASSGPAVTSGPLELFLEKRGGKQTEVVARRGIGNAARLRLKISADARAYSFYVGDGGAGWQALVENDDGSILSSDVAGGFVGAFVGPFARKD